MVAAVLMAYALPRVEGFQLTVWQVLLYPVYVLAGIGILYSLTIVLAAASVWLGRNTSIYDFWFYITTFSRYPMEIYQGPIGDWLRLGVHVRAADSDRGQRAGPDAGQAAAAGVRLPGSVRASWRPSSSLRRQPLGVSAGAVELSQREQLMRCSLLTTTARRHDDDANRQNSLRVFVPFVVNSWSA